MGAAGWVHYLRDLRDEHATIARMAAAADGATVLAENVRLGRQAGFAFHGDASYAWSKLGRLGPDVAVVFEGRIANREQLQARLGLSPRTEDAVLVRDAYREWDAGLVHRLDGVYAIAVWDRRRRRLLLITDPMGHQAWFYHRQEHGLLFGTRVRAVIAHPATPREVAADGLNELLTLGPIRTPGHAVVRGIREVPAGHVLVVEPGKLDCRAYWHWQPQRHSHDSDTSAGLVRRLLADATIPLRQQPPEAILLSGGLASAAVAAFTSTARRPTAYTVTLADPSTTPPGLGADVSAAAHVSRHLDIQHRYIALGPDELTTNQRQVSNVLDFPGDGESDTPLFAAMRRLMDDGIARVVSGAGADGVFGNYPWLRVRHPTASDTFPWLRPPLTSDRLLSDDAREHLQPESYRQQAWSEARRAVPHVKGEFTPARIHRQMTYLALTRYLPAQLRRIGQLATAAGLDVQTPMADFVLAQYLLNVPAAIRHVDGRRLGLLRRAVADLLPRPLACHGATPFPGAQLLNGWRRHQHGQLRQLLADSDQPLRPLLDRPRIAPLLGCPAAHLPSGWWPLVTRLLDVNTWLARHNITLA